MRNNIPLALVVFAAVVAAAFRMAVWRPKLRAGSVEVAEPLGPPRRPVSAVELGQDVFHELHAEGRNAACTVCDSRYQAALLGAGPAAWLVGARSADRVADVGLAPDRPQDVRGGRRPVDAVGRPHAEAGLCSPDGALGL